MAMSQMTQLWLENKFWCQAKAAITLCHITGLETLECRKALLDSNIRGYEFTADDSFRVWYRKAHVLELASLMVVAG